jgi:hypothetical protein
LRRALIVSKIALTALELISVGGGSGPDVRGSIDVYPEILVTPLGFEDGRSRRL